MSFLESVKVIPTIVLSLSVLVCLLQGFLSPSGDKINIISNFSLVALSTCMLSQNTLILSNGLVIEDLKALTAYIVFDNLISILAGFIALNLIPSVIEASFRAFKLSRAEFLLEHAKNAKHVVDRLERLVSFLSNFWTYFGTFCVVLIIIFFSLAWIDNNQLYQAIAADVLFLETVMGASSLGVSFLMLLLGVRDTKNRLQKSTGTKMTSSSSSDANAPTSGATSGGTSIGTAPSVSSMAAVSDNHDTIIRQLKGQQRRFLLLVVCCVSICITIFYRWFGSSHAEDPALDSDVLGGSWVSYFVQFATDLTLILIFFFGLYKPWNRQNLELSVGYVWYTGLMLKLGCVPSVQVQLQRSRSSTQDRDQNNAHFRRGTGTDLEYVSEKRNDVASKVSNVNKRVKKNVRSGRNVRNVKNVGNVRNKAQLNINSGPRRSASYMKNAGARAAGPESDRSHAVQMSGLEAPSTPVTEDEHNGHTRDESATVNVRNESEAEIKVVIYQLEGLIAFSAEKLAELKTTPSNAMDVLSDDKVLKGMSSDALVQCVEGADEKVSQVRAHLDNVTSAGVRVVVTSGQVDTNCLQIIVQMLSLTEYFEKGVGVDGMRSILGKDANGGSAILVVRKVTEKLGVDGQEILLVSGDESSVKLFEKTKICAVHALDNTQNQDLVSLENLVVG